MKNKNPYANMQQELDDILERVIDRQSGGPVANIGLVERFRLQPNKKKLIVFCRIMNFDHACCLVMNNHAYDQTIDDLRTEIQRSFPDLTVQFVYN